MKSDHQFKQSSLTLIWLWLIFFAVIPFTMVIISSFLSHNDGQLFTLPFTLDNYKELNNPLYFHVFKKSILLAGSATLICLILGYPFAFIIARIHGPVKNILLLLIIIPFWTSSLIRSYALIALIKAKGILNSILIAAGIIHQPISILFTNYAVIIGLVYNLLPFMILPIMTNIERLDNNLIDAAKDLGAPQLTIFRRIIIPLTMPGMIAGSILVFLPAMTLFYITDILGGAKSILLGNLIQDQFLVTQNWPLGSAASTVLTIILASLLLIHRYLIRDNNKKEWL